MVAALPAAAQMGGRVGQGVDPNGSVTNSPLRAGPQISQSLPTLDDEARTEEARRKAAERERAIAAAGGSTTMGRVRAPVRREVRRAFRLTRVPNKAVVAPQSVTATAGAPSVYSPVIAPGLSELPAARRKRPDPEKDPYAPLGLRMGGFTVLPAIEASLGYDNNPLRGSSGRPYKGSRLYQVTPELSVQSDWSNHAAQLDLRGTYSIYQDVKDADRPTFDGKLSVRGDLTKDTTLTFEVKEKIDSQRPGSADLSSAVKGRPLYYITSGSAALAQKFGRGTVTATALVDRADYMDGTTYSGGTLSQKDRNYTTYGGKLRGAYELTPGISPFVEVSGDTRDYDEKIDSAGYRRSSQGVIGRAGTTLELTRTLTGEVSGGWGLRRYDDTRLSDLTGPVVDTSLIWQFSPLTKLTLKAGTEFVETTQNGSPGAISRKVSAEVAHDLLRNLTITGSAGFASATYKGINRIEDTITAGLKADYKIDRMFVVRGSYAYERSLSNQVGASYLSHTFLAGLRIQR